MMGMTAAACRSAAEVLLETLFLLVSENGVGDLLGIGRAKGRCVQGPEGAIDANHRRRVGRQMEVGGSLLDHGLEHRVQCRWHVNSPNCRGPNILREFIPSAFRQ